MDVEKETDQSLAARLPQMDPFVVLKGTPEPSEPAVVPLRGLDRGLRIRGKPVAHGSTAPSSSGEILAHLASLSSSLKELRAEQDRDLLEALRRDVSAVRDSVEQLEAFVTITFANRMNETISQRLTVIKEIERAHHRLRRWLTGFIVLSAAMVLAFWLEAETGAVIPLLGSLAETVSGLFTRMAHGIQVFAGRATSAG